MTTIDISYNPYRMETTFYINGKNVCNYNEYDAINEFIKEKTPLQTWIDPIPFLDWPGLLNYIVGFDHNDELIINYSGREIDRKDLQRAIDKQNAKRSDRTKVKYKIQHQKILDDAKLSADIDVVVKELQSDRFRELVEQRSTEDLKANYQRLADTYKLAKETEFYVVFAGVYSSGKSTIINNLMRHDVLPTAYGTCTSKNCRIRHDKALGKKIAMVCYDDKQNVVIEKRIFDTDIECANAFLEIYPKKDTSGAIADVPNVNVDGIELYADLSHLYPKGFDQDQFRMVLIDTPGSDSAQSIENGINKHAQLALQMISDKNKPMVVFCTDAKHYEGISIGAFMGEILTHSQGLGSGFNDRFLFIMNKSEEIEYGNGDSIDEVKSTFAKYLINSEKWGLDINEEDLKKLATQASHFVPRIFMTSARIDYAVRNNVLDFSDEELNEDPQKEIVLDAFEAYQKKICRRKNRNYYLSSACDIPTYRKAEIEKEFDMAMESGDFTRASQLQCGICALEYAIKDYMERYAYPIKVRSLLETFDDILEDVDRFTNSTYEVLQELMDSLGKSQGEGEEATTRIKELEEKINVVKKARESVESNFYSLDNIVFDSNALRKVNSDLETAIEMDKTVSFLRPGRRIETGAKSHSEIEKEIADMIAHVEGLFTNAIQKANDALKVIADGHDRQIDAIYDVLNKEIEKLKEHLECAGFDFKNSITWRKNFDNLNSKKFHTDIQRSITDKKEESIYVINQKKLSWRSSSNPFKKLGALFMNDYKNEIKTTQGSYSTQPLVACIDGYYQHRNIKTSEMEAAFKSSLERGKFQAQALIQKLLVNLEQFLEDIEKVKKLVDALDGNIDELKEKIAYYEKLISWLEELKEKIKGV